MINHSHKFTIADQDAVHVLVKKMVNEGRGTRKKPSSGNLLRALGDAARHYDGSSQKMRQAFFHGLLTGYAVAFQLMRERGSERARKPRFRV